MSVPPKALPRQSGRDGSNARPSVRGLFVCKSHMVEFKVLCIEKHVCCTRAYGSRDALQMCCWRGVAAATEGLPYQIQGTHFELYLYPATAVLIHQDSRKEGEGG